MFHVAISKFAAPQTISLKMRCRVDRSNRAIKVSKVKLNQYTVDLVVQCTLSLVVNLRCYSTEVRAQSGDGSHVLVIRQSPTKTYGESKPTFK